MKNAKRMKVSRRISSTTAETTTDIEMSIHSDSDIIDIPDNDSDITYFEDGDTCGQGRMIAEIEGDIWEEIAMLHQKELPEEEEDKRTETVRVRQDIDIDCAFTDEGVKNTADNEDVKKDVYIPQLRNEKEENEKTFDSIAIENKWDLGYTVLVRYYVRKSWKYYVGRIAAIDNLRHIYSIVFYKTIKKNGLKFVNKGSKDQVPYSNIVKYIELVQIKENLETYVLHDEKDKKYF